MNRRMFFALFSGLLAFFGITWKRKEPKYDGPIYFEGNWSQFPATSWHDEKWGDLPIPLDQFETDDDFAAALLKGDQIKDRMFYLKRSHVLNPEMFHLGKNEVPVFCNYFLMEDGAHIELSQGSYELSS